MNLSMTLLEWHQNLFRKSGACSSVPRSSSHASVPEDGSKSGSTGVVTPANGGTRLASVELSVPIQEPSKWWGFSKFDSCQFYYLKPYIFEEFSVLTSNWLTQEPLSQFFHTVLATLLLRVLVSIENHRWFWHEHFWFLSDSFPVLFLWFEWTFLLVDVSMPILDSDFFSSITTCWST